jgi:hypothetical protein
MSRLRVEHKGRGRLYISGGSWRLRLAAGIAGVAILGGGLALAATSAHPRTAVLTVLVIYLFNAILVVGQSRRRRRRVVQATQQDSNL